MGKTRVYELAKQLNMSNKELVNKLKEMGYSIKSHSSTVDDSQVSEIKGRLEGRKSKEMAEKKVRTTVIRRRKKIVEMPPEETAPPVSAQEPVQEAPPGEPLPEIQLAEEEPAVEAVSEVPEPKEITAESVAEEPVEPEVEAAEEPLVEEKVAAPEEPKPEEEEKPKVKSKEKPAKKGKKKRAKEPAEKGKPKPKIKKIARPKGEPARIISRPKVVLPPPKPEPKPEKKPAAKPAPFSKPRPKKPLFELPVGDVPPIPEATKPRKKKKVKAKPEIDDLVKVAPKKGFKRKEIIEGADLYDEPKAGRPRTSRFRKAARVAKKGQKPSITVPKAIKRRVKISEAVTVAELAKKMGVKAQDVLRKLIAFGLLVNINQAIDFDAAELVASEFDYEVTKDTFDEEEAIHLEEVEDTDLTPRSPVVTVMGHVDHGKTSLLDVIRQTNIIDGEAGGITQHIGAYHVKLDAGNITFLDTPGHEAFTSMRARGAQITDIVILVVAADDGAMEQTREAINHAKAAGVPVMVAVNKIDKPGADPERVKRDLAELGLVPEDWGGDTIFANVSAKTGEGVTELLDLILLQAELLELKAAVRGRAQGRVIEANLDKGRGPVATILIQSGLLRDGDAFVCGVYHGKIRSMLNDNGKRVDQAGPSMPVEIQGIAGVPGAGDEFVVLEDDKRARQISQHRQLKQRETELIKTTKVTLENIYERVKEGELKELNLLLKTDVQGSLEAIQDALFKLSTDEIKINIIHSNTGPISETDVMLAATSDASIFGFNVRPNAKVQELAESENVEIRYYNVIYKLTEEVKEAMIGLLEPTYVEETIGTAEVRQAFHVSKVGTIAGSAVTSGKIVRNAKVRLLREGVVLFDGALASLKRFKDDAREVASGYECGIGLENFNDIKVGDTIEAYIVEEVAATL
ncbi:MAG: translation initiation factor IF-2 [Deltaproteobacteria bacterium]|nr:translation initiation factor IF-2 [Deltaproteobacteria bacterium]